MASPATASEQRDAFVGRLFESAINMMEICCLYVGDRLGLYRALRAIGPATAAELAGAAKVDARYAREWLEQQAVAGVLETDATADEGMRRYSLPAGHADVLLDADSLSWFAPVEIGSASCRERVYVLV